MLLSLNNLVLAGLLASSATAAAPLRKVPKGFVTVDGNKFMLDGKSFYFAGSNAYYFPFNEQASDVEKGLIAAKQAGLTVFRTWGFNDKNKTYIQTGLPQYGSEGAGATNNVFQVWDSGKPTIKLEAFDKVINAAEKTGMKLIVALTNNWADYGGMDVYTVNLGGKYHDDFYRLPAIKGAFKNYVRAFVSRYASSPAIMAWELANEPRCGADNVRNLPRSEHCTPELLTAWIDEMSSFVKSIDRHHLVTWGGEGGFNYPGDPDGFYNGYDGGDFDKELALKSIDFGTLHAYPDWWSKTVEWTVKWFQDHAKVGRKVGKPVVAEEYGWLTDQKRLEYLNKVSNISRLEAMGAFQKTALEEKMPDMYWQFGYSGYSYGRNHNDGFTIYLDDPEAKTLIYEHAQKVNALNGKRH